MPATALEQMILELIDRARLDLGDFNGDGTSDILLENADGVVIDWMMNNGAISGSHYVGGASGWTIAGTGDFNGDGVCDILLQSASGAVLDWTMSNGVISGVSLIGNGAGWKAA